MHTEHRCRRDAAQRFWIVQRLGSGGMGAVYEAIDTRSARRVAIKVLRQGRTDPTAARRALEREAGAMKIAAGAGVCRVDGVTQCYGQPCLVMERLVGCTLQARLAAGRMDIWTAVQTSAQIAAALETIHRAGVIHSDIKPSNVFVTESGRVKIVDFGLATMGDRSKEAGVASSQTAAAVLGTASYVAPERILRAPVDRRSDLFSLGAVMYEMAFGRPPFAAASASEALFNVLECDPPAAPAPRSTVAAAFDRLARVLLAKDPAARVESALQVVRALNRLRKHRTAAERRSAIHRPFHTRGIDHAFVHAGV